MFMWVVQVIQIPLQVKPLRVALMVAVVVFLEIITPAVQQSDLVVARQTLVQVLPLQIAFWLQAVAVVLVPITVPQSWVVLEDWLVAMARQFPAEAAPV